MLGGLDPGTLQFSLVFGKVSEPVILLFSCRIVPEAHQSMVQLYHDILHSAVKLGVPLPVDENVCLSSRDEISC